MYGLVRQSLNSPAALPSSVGNGFRWTAVGQTVILLGVTSLLTDVSAEMVAAILLLYQLQVSVLQLGVIDGLYQGASGLVRLAAAFTADRWRRDKEVAASGYALSALSRIGLLLAGGAVAGIAGFILVDRIGKGIRTAPRDSLISLSVPEARLGVAFGVHRTFDTAGSLIGPLVAFALLTAAPGAFDAVFLPSFAIALIGLGVIVLFVENRRTSQSLMSSRLHVADCLRVLVAPRFRALAVSAGVLSLFTMSDAFLYIGLQRRSSLALNLFPLLFDAFEARGVPSRVRVSADDRYGSATVFVSGDSYGAPFSTRTFLFDLSSGQNLGNLEDFDVFKDGTQLQSPDFNFWGTTFAVDDNHFYATLGTGGVDGITYLVKGDISTRQLQVLRENVECPSLSPDGARIAFKKRVDANPGNWRLAVLNLATLQDTLISSESRSIDDQVEWRDNTHLLYAVTDTSQPGALADDIWQTATDGSEPPEIVLSGALSPSVIR